METHPTPEKWFHSRFPDTSMWIINTRRLPPVEIAREMSVRVAGSTDAVNRELRGRRAQSNVDYLIRRGIDPARLVAKETGSSRPVASHETTVGRVRNRRTGIPAAHTALQNTEAEPELGR